jgi:Nucleotidyltransferase of unknown function (DUF6036)
MELSDLLRRLTETLEKLQVPYIVTGSMATIAYGEPRFTNDIDVVVDLKPTHVSAFCEAFPEPDFYCPRDFVADAVRRKFQFNILHPESGYKIDVMLATDSEFDRTRLSRAARVQSSPDSTAWFASPEDVIIKKLQYYREGGSEKHIRDILGVLKIRGERVDRTYIAEWASRLGLVDEWNLVLARLSPPTE